MDAIYICNLQIIIKKAYRFIYYYAQALNCVVDNYLC